MRMSNRTIKRLYKWNAYCFAGLVGGAFFILVASESLAQINSTDEATSLEPDVLPVIVPFEMEVTGLDLDAGVIYLNGDGYSLEVLKGTNNRAESSRNRMNLDLKLLRIGERVIVETDGTAPSDTRLPFITSIRQP